MAGQRGGRSEKPSTVKIVGIHPVADLFPPTVGEAFELLMADIERNGLKIPPVVNRRGVLLDGRGRYRACTELQERYGDELASAARLRIEVVSLPPEREADLIMTLNQRRRHMSIGQSAMVAARWGALEGSGSLADRAKAVGVSVRTLQHAETVLRSGYDDLIADVDSAKITVSAAAGRAVRRREAMNHEPALDRPLPMLAGRPAVPARIEIEAQQEAFRARIRDHDEQPLAGEAYDVGPVEPVEPGDIGPADPDDIARGIL